MKLGRYRCKYCGRIFEAKEHYKRNTCPACKKRKFVCAYCGKAFSRRVTSKNATPKYCCREHSALALRGDTYKFVLEHFRTMTQVQMAKYLGLTKACINGHVKRIMREEIEKI